MRTCTQLVVLLLGPIGALADCNHNNCLRAVIGDAFPTRNGPADCSSYLRVTVTPPTSTFTATVTVPTDVSVSSTIVETLTAVETVVASTETVYNEETTTVEETETATQIIATTKTVEVVGRVAARQATAYGSTFPAYASPCTNFPKYSSACSCLGYYPDTVTVAAPSTYITEYVTSTSTSTLLTTTSSTTVSSQSITDTTLVTSTVTVPTDVTTTTSTTATATATNIVTNGGFERPVSSAWQVSRGTGSKTAPGSNSANSVRSQNLHDNNLFEMWQTLQTVPGNTYTCSYDWKFTNFYATLYKDGNTYVPYVHVYIQWTPDNYQIYSNVQPDQGTVNQWQTATFTFTALGNDQLYFDCASPQATGNKPGQGNNYVSLDNVVCVVSS